MYAVLKYIITHLVNSALYSLSCLRVKSLKMLYTFILGTTSSPFSCASLICWRRFRIVFSSLQSSADVADMLTVCVWLCTTIFCDTLLYNSLSKTLCWILSAHLSHAFSVWGVNAHTHTAHARPQIVWCVKSKPSAVWNLLCVCSDGGGRPAYNTERMYIYRERVLYYGTLYTHFTILYTALRRFRIAKRTNAVLWLNPGDGPGTNGELTESEPSRPKKQPTPPRKQVNLLGDVFGWCCGGLRAGVVCDCVVRTRRAWRAIIILYMWRLV